MLRADVIEEMFADLELRAADAVDARRASRPSARRSSGSVEVRFVRQTKAIEVPYRGSAERRCCEDFLDVYASRYGEAAVPELAGFELVTFVVAAAGALRRPGSARSAGRARPRARPARRAAGVRPGRRTAS